MKDLLNKILEEGEWKPLRFMVYNYLEEREFYQKHLEQSGYDSGYDDLEGKIFACDNVASKQFKRYVENNLQGGMPIIAICVVDDSNYFTVVKPKSVDIYSVLQMN